MTWHSESGALPESKLVFLENSGVAKSLAEGQSVRVFEVGFGTGLNFWLTASKALSLAQPAINHCELEFVSVEPNLLDAEVIQKLEHGTIAACQPAFDEFLEDVFCRTDNVGPITFQKQNVRLTILRNEIQTLDLQELGEFDAIYHDPFSHETAPELWSETMMRGLSGLMKEDCRLVTYCVKSAFQRTLRTLGFEIEKTPGPVGGKREVLIARKS